MLKKIAVYLLLFCAVNSYAQQELIVLDDYFFDTEYSTLKDAFPIVNKNNNDVSLFLLSAKHVYGFLLDETFKVKKEIKSENRDRQFKVIIGYSVSDNDEYRVFLTNNQKDEFARINISYSNSRTGLKEFFLQQENEFFVQSINQDNKFYLLSVLKDSSILKLYTFNDLGEYSVKEFDFSRNIFLNEKGAKANLYNMIPGVKSTNESSTKKIEKEVPTSIEVASEKVKMYIKGTEVLLTFDRDKKFTQVISIDLISHEKYFSAFEKPFVNVKANKKRTNSFINGDNIFIVASTKEDFIFKVLNRSTKELLKEYIVNVNDSISFKNSPIIQKGGVYDGYREFDQKNKFLRKISSGNIGVSVNHYKNGYKVVLGGKKEVTNGAGMAMGMMGGIGTSMGDLTLYFNPVNFAYSSYVNSRSTFINCLFDSSFNHQQGEFPKNIFDKIRDYEEDIYNQKNSESNVLGEDSLYKNLSSKGDIIFKYKDFYIKGSTLIGGERYILRKFEE